MSNETRCFLEAMRSHGPRLAVAVLLAASCHGADARQPSPTDSTVAAAIHLAERFVSADTSGDLKAAQSLWLPMDGMTYCEMGSDSYAIVDSAAISPLAVRQDTVRLRLSYHQVGTAHGEDPHQVGPKDLRFQARVFVEVDTVEIAHDSTGRLGFLCDHYRVSPNHTSVAQFATGESRLDSASLAAWRSASSRAVTRPDPDPSDTGSSEPLRHLVTGTWHVVRDTAEWDCGGNGGRFGKLYHDSVFVDSIDLSSGYTVTPKGILFAPVRADSAGGELAICPEDPIMWNGRSRRPLKQILPYYDAGFPGWLFSDSALLYWGFVHYRAYAVRYDFRTSKADTTFLVEDTALFATDNRFQFAPPDSVDSTYVFDVFQKTRFTLDRHLRLLATSRQ